MKWREEKSFFLLFLPGGAGFTAARSGQGRAVLQARRERPLDGEDRCECIVLGGKALALHGVEFESTWSKL